MIMYIMENPISRLCQNYYTFIQKKNGAYKQVPPNFMSKQVNVLGIGLCQDKIFEIFGSGVILSENKGDNFHKIHYKCNEYNILDIVSIEPSYILNKASEELQIIVSGRIQWGYEMKPRGWFDISDGYYYQQNTIAPFDSVAHIIIIDNTRVNLDVIIHDVMTYVKKYCRYEPSIIHLNDLNIQKMDKAIQKSFIKRFNYHYEKIYQHPKDIGLGMV